MSLKHDPCPQKASNLAGSHARHQILRLPPRKKAFMSKPDRYFKGVLMPLPAEARSPLFTPTGGTHFLSKIPSAFFFFCHISIITCGLEVCALCVCVVRAHTCTCIFSPPLLSKCLPDSIVLHTVHSP